MTRPSAVQIATAALVLILAAYSWINWQRLQSAEERFAAADRQADLNAEATRQLDHFTTTTTIIREKAEEAEHEVRSAPGASAPLEPDNRRALCSALERVRGTAVCTDAGAGDVP